VIVALDITLFVILIATAILALRSHDLLTSVVLLTAYSLFASLLFTGLLAVDVGLVEAALGAGLTGIIFLVALLATTSSADATDDRRRRLVMSPMIVGFVGLMVFASGGLPDRGDPDAPTRTGVSATYLADSLTDADTENVVTSLLADYRSLDTLGETLVILTAALGTALVLRRRPDRPDTDADQPPADVPAPAAPGPGPGPEETGPAETGEVGTDREVEP
jgi:multicomponent Na+:H+ antiporter subunit B